MNRYLRDIYVTENRYGFAFILFYGYEKASNKYMANLKKASENFGQPSLFCSVEEIDKNQRRILVLHKN